MEDKRHKPGLLPSARVDPKRDAGAVKPRTSDIPPSAIFALGRAMADGAGKYGTFNWRQTEVESLTYFNAAMRHLLAWRDGDDKAEDSGVHHLAHVMACCAIVLDSIDRGVLIDNREPEG